MKKIIVSMLVMLLLLNIVSLSIHGREAVGQPSFNLGSQIPNFSVGGFDAPKNNFSEILAGFDLPIELEFPYFVPGELIVKFSKDTSICTSVSSDGVINTGVESIDKLNREYMVTNAEELFVKNPDSELSQIYKLSISRNTDIFSAIEKYNSDPNVEFAEPNYNLKFYAIQSNLSKLSHPSNPIPPKFIPNDPYFDMQWALDNYGQNGGTPDADIDAPEAWDIETGSSDVIIAVVDSGVDYNHPDLADNIWRNSDEIPNNNIDDDNNGYIDDSIGWDFEDDDNDPMDDLYHGTHCAGIIAAVTDNAVGIAGVAGNCKIMPLKISTSTEAAKAIKYAVDNGADVISMSFVIIPFFDINGSFLLSLSLTYADLMGVVLIAAAGNDNFNFAFPPASHKKVVAVAATDNTDTKAWFSSYGIWVDVAAPGVNIYSTVPVDNPIFGFISELIVNEEIYDSKAFAYTGTGNVSGELVYVGLGRTQDLEGIDLTDKIALIKRGEIEFEEKVNNVYGKNAIGAIIFNNESGNFWGGLREKKQIPVVSLSLEEGLIIVQLLDQGMVQGNLTVIDHPYESTSGTSMACPIVSGAAALVLSQNPRLTPREVRTILRSSTDSINSNKYIGTGRINAYEAVQKAVHVVAELSRSLDHKILEGTTKIKGTAKGLSFQEYVVEYSQDIYPDEDSWIEIGSSNKRKYGGVLVSWDTTTVNDGPYTLRLRVIADSKTFEDRTFVIVDNNATMYYIDDDYNSSTPGWGVDHFDNIPDAVMLSGNKDTIYVHQGTYSDFVNIQRRSVTILGEDREKTILTGEVEVLQGSLCLKNFTIKERGVQVYLSSNCVISENTFTDFGFKFLNKPIILGLFSSKNVITKNLITSPFEIFGNIQVICFSNDNYITDNTIINNITDNFIISCGILVSSSGPRRNVISNNSISKCDYGIYLQEGASKNTVAKNTISDNNYGIFLRDANNNKIYQNNFLRNDKHAYDMGSNIWYRPVLMTGNYWDDYKEKYPNAKPRFLMFWIWDTPYDIDGGSNQDKYPLMDPYEDSPLNNNINSQSSQPSSQQTTTTTTMTGHSNTNRYSLLIPEVLQVERK